MHPFPIHGFGPKWGNRIRFACNPLVQMTELALLDRPHGDYSAVEFALRKGLGLCRSIDADRLMTGGFNWVIHLIWSG